MARLAPLPIRVLSVFVLLSFCNFALEVVHAQMHQLDSPYLYDTLSPEVISPPFHYKSASTKAQRRLGLGSAAIASVTEALSPILPFTGGIDLRREELWDNDKGWFSSVSTVFDQVRDAFGLDTAINLPRGGGAPLKTKTPPTNKKLKTSHLMPISDAKPFYPLSKIADLTLGDLTTFFQYASHQKYVLNDRTKPALAALENAVQTSRGKHVLSSREGGGNVDALSFCAAMRIFAEWRMVRQVPEGYKGYAVGMNLGHKDIVQNLAKMEAAAHEWLDYRREQIALEKAWQGTSEVDDELRSPTLRDLLEHEIDMEVHSRLPRLKEKTAAMGLLWVRRQLHYQTSIFSNILKVPEKYANSNAAVAAAYTEVYGHYHGWAVQKIFNYSFQAAPQVQEIYKFMNPHRLKAVKEEAQRIMMTTTKHQVDFRVQESFADCCSDDKNSRAMNPLERFGHHLSHEWDKFGRHVGGEWDKFVDNVVRVFDQDSPSRIIRGGAQLGGDELDRFVTERMQQDAHDHIVVYLESVLPLLKNLEQLFEELNMDDPTKV